MLNFSSIDEVKFARNTGEFDYSSSAFYLPDERKYGIFFNFRKFYEDNAYISSLWETVRDNMEFSFTVFSKGIPKQTGIFEKTTKDDLYLAKFNEFLEGSEIQIRCKDFDTFLAVHAQKNIDDDFLNKYYSEFSKFVPDHDKLDVTKMELLYHMKRFYENRPGILERCFPLFKYNIVDASNFNDFDDSERCQLYAFDKILQFKVSEKSISSLWIFDAFRISGDDRQKLRGDFSELQRTNSVCEGRADSSSAAETARTQLPILQEEKQTSPVAKKRHYFLITKDGFHLPNSFFGMYESDRRDSFILSDSNGFYLVNE